ncbi:chemotaxis protein MotB [Palleronia aestuarii]|uniref:Chemotaxis protein MotB n=1 Tax=Palleronia aestuarii TaxID=568105 RepID=A0A2W7NGC2_9RHOB|nr:peptidoglycan -binding protein [Palleronia aestuarii]PZX15774.1 chemotaxis protein MotB [Palleronia aestuarii]
MALMRRSTHRVTASIWPGFVDAMTALLLVMMFLLTIFMVVQFVLREEISGQQTRLGTLSEEVAGLTEALGLATARTEALEGERDDLLAVLDDRSQRIDALEATTADQAGRIAGFEERMDALMAERERDRARISGLETRGAELSAEGDRLASALSAARDEIDEEAERARLAAARADALEALTADLREDLSARGEEVETLTANLSESEAARLTEAAAAEVLRARLEASETELSAAALALDAERARAEETLTLLAAARSAEADLDARLAAALLAQEDLEADLAGARSDGAELAATLDAERTRLAAALATRADLAAERDRLDERITALSEERETEREAAAERIGARETELATLRDRLEAALAERLAAEEAAETRLSEAETRAVLLSQARSALADEEEVSAEARREVALLNAQVGRLREELSAMQTLLDAEQSAGSEQDLEIESLGNQLNAALAREAAEQRRRAELEEAERERLETYRSEFFGKLREVVGDREGIAVSGDRFVFDSEVLFPSGSARLSDEGRDQVRRVASILEEISDDIPPGIDWVIRVDGHTDDVPISGNGRYADNWELSQARALSVVRFMSDDLGFPARRLAPTGFGAYRPVAEGSSPEARAQNRRIEMKLTER